MNIEDCPAQHLQTLMLLSPKHGQILDMASDEFPTIVRCVDQGSLALADEGTHFGFVYSGNLELERRSSRFTLHAGMYFSLPEGARITGSGLTLLITRLGPKAFFQVGGPIEDRGRLRYIDGCTDSLLVCPTVRGDACLNLLHFPPGTEQTMHTHPSARFGIIAKGEGLCRTLGGEFPMRAGDIFCIPSNVEHSFLTRGSAMLVIAYHPDSDFGPTDQEHPMINRTMVNGLSASRIGAIHTLAQ